MSQITTGIRSILSSPLVYNSFQALVGTPNMRRYVIKKNITSGINYKILDIGCGTGELIEYLPKGFDYTGFDLSNDYIEYAKKKYGKLGSFQCMDVNDYGENAAQYDVVLIFTLLHHLNDAEAKTILKKAHQCLKPGGFTLSVDGVYFDGQDKLAKYILSKDRGQHIRHRDDYIKLAKDSYSSVEVEVKSNLFRMPTDVIIMKMFK